MQVEFGESLRLVGSDSVLGSWDVAQGPALRWSDGDVWTLDLEVPAGQQLSFKVWGVSRTYCRHWNIQCDAPGSADCVKTEQVTETEAILTAYAAQS